MRPAYFLLPVAVFTPLDNAEEKFEVKERACAALEVFASNMGDEILQYLEPLMGKLFSLLKSDNKEVQQTAVSAISSVALASKQSFAPYFQDTITMLRTLMTQKSDELLE